MGVYIKKPIEIEALQINDSNQSSKWIKKACETEILKFSSDGFFVKTIEGIMFGEYGSYLIKGVEGELYPCRKDIFEKTYDFVREEKNND